MPQRYSGRPLSPGHRRPRSSRPDRRSPPTPRLGRPAAQAGGPQRRDPAHERHHQVRHATRVVGHDAAGPDRHPADLLLDLVEQVVQRPRLMRSLASGSRGQMAKPSSINWSVGALGLHEVGDRRGDRPGTVDDRPTQCGRDQLEHPAVLDRDRLGEQLGLAVEVRRGRRGEPGVPGDLLDACPCSPSPGRSSAAAWTSRSCRSPRGGRSSCGRPTGGDRRRSATGPSGSSGSVRDGTTRGPGDRTAPQRPADGPPDRKGAHSGSARAAGGGDDPTSAGRPADRPPDPRRGNFNSKFSAAPAVGRHDGHRRDPEGQVPAAPLRRDDAAHTGADRPPGDDAGSR